MSDQARLILATREKKEGADKKLAALLKKQQEREEQGRVERAKVIQNAARLKASIAQDEADLVKFKKDFQKDLKKHGDMARPYYETNMKKINARLKMNRQKLKGTEKRETGKQKYIHLKLKYIVRVYMGGKAGEYQDIEKEIEDYFGIRFKNQEEYNKKLEEAKDRLLMTTTYELVSGAEVIVDAEARGEVLKWEVDDTLSLKQLRATASDPTKIPFYKATVPIDYQFLPVDLNHDENGKKVSCLDRYILKTYKKDMPTLCQQDHHYKTSFQQYQRSSSGVLRYRSDWEDDNRRYNLPADNVAAR